MRMASGSERVMAEVVIYTEHFCGHCSDAKRLLHKRGVPFREVGRREGGGRAGLRERFGPDFQTFPQIVIDGRHVGGAADLAALAASGELDRLLAGGAAGYNEDTRAGGGGRGEAVDGT